MHQTKKGKHWYYGMKCPIDMDAGTGLVHAAAFTAANVSGIATAHEVIRPGDHEVYGDAGYIGIAKRSEIRENPDPADIEYTISEKTGKRRVLSGIAREWTDQLEKRKSFVHSRVQHVFRIVKIGFGCVKRHTAD